MQVSILVDPDDTVDIGRAVKLLGSLTAIALLGGDVTPPVQLPPPDPFSAVAPPPAPVAPTNLFLEAPPAAPPPPGPATNDDGVRLPPPLLDKAGVQWDPEKHTANKNTKMDGTWKTKRGLGKPDTPSPGTAPQQGGEVVTLEQVHAALGKLSASGADLTGLDAPMSKAVLGDLSAETGGMAALIGRTATEGGERRAMNAIRAFALQNGVAL